MSPTDVTLAINAAWGGAGLLIATAAVILMYLRLPSLSMKSRTLAICVMLSGFGVWVHRTFWNVAIVLRPDDGLYSAIMLEQRHYLAVPITAIVAAAFLGVATLVPRSRRWAVLGASFAALLVHIGAWLVIEAWIQ